ncbi:M13 family metallopeptidase [Burkholderiaceae bacterium DAT-1]|nr:M13 family metallopeptidase [Burkholderiaceae bacterium DAT-1]
MRRLVLALCAAGLYPLTASALAADASADQPFTSLPYTPSLDNQSMDRTANPCQDFYQYACGGWIKNNPIPSDKSSWSVYGKLAHENQRYLWGILDSLSKQTEGRTVSQQKIGDYFGACMDESGIEKRGLAPAQSMLDQVAGLKDRQVLPALLATLHGRGVSGFFNFGSEQDYTNSDNVIAGVGAGGIGLPERDFYLKTDPKSKALRLKYIQHIERVLVQSGTSKAAAKRDAAAILALETRLAKAQLGAVDLRDPYKTSHKMGLDKLKAMTPAFAWDQYLKQLGAPDFAELNVGQPAYMKALNRELSSLPLDVVRAYLRWNVMRASASSLTAAIDREHFDFYGTALMGTPKQAPRWQRCVQNVDNQLGEALGKEFTDRAFTPKLKADTQKMTRQIEDAMEADIKALSWMSDTTKKRAIEKLHAVANKVGYPDRWRDYSSVEIRPDDFFGNSDRATVFEIRRQLAKIGKPVDRSEWSMTPPTVNAYYNPQMNDINFPAGVLQPPLYDPKMDDAPNYGNTGSTIGHELTHGFDDSGRQFDGKGNLKDWWEKDDAKAFNEHAACIVKQYSTYTIIDELKINGRLTQGEDIADLGGLILAWMAWKAEVVGQNLPDVDGLTPEQRFFVGYAQWACENTRPETQRVHALTNPHSPGKYRVNGLMVNMPEFEQAFACHKGDAMVPEKRCRVW